MPHGMKVPRGRRQPRSIIVRARIFAGRSACPELAELVLASPRIHFAKIAIGPNCATGSIVIDLAVVAECLILLLQDLSERVARDRVVDVLGSPAAFARGSHNLLSNPFLVCTVDRRITSDRADSLS